MKLARCLLSDGREVIVEVLPSQQYRRVSGEILSPGVPTDDYVQPERLLAPLTPSAIWGIGLNYHSNGNFLGVDRPDYPLLFIKQPSSVHHPSSPILLPSRLPVHQVDFEGELAVIINRVCKNVRPDEVWDYIGGYTCANDVTARDWQKDKRLSGGQFARAKSFDTFCPLGPYVVTPDSMAAPQHLAIRTWLNGELMQDDNTKNMIFPIPYLIAYLSAETTLFPGTVILTGSPTGTLLGRSPERWLVDGDRIEIEIEGIGRLENSVAASTASPFSTDP